MLGSPDPRGVLGSPLLEQSSRQQGRADPPLSGTPFNASRLSLPWARLRAQTTYLATFHFLSQELRWVGFPRKSEAGRACDHFSQPEFGSENTHLPTSDALGLALGS